jgi:hypothetical protein
MLICIGKPIGTQGEIRVLHFFLFLNYFVAYFFLHVQIMGAPELNSSTFPKMTKNS